MRYGQIFDRIMKALDKCETREDKITMLKACLNVIELKGEWK